MQRRNHTPCHNHILFLPSNPYLKHISKDKREKRSPRPPLSQSQTPSLIILLHHPHHILFPPRHPRRLLIPNPPPLPNSCKPLLPRPVLLLRFRMRKHAPVHRESLLSTYPCCRDGAVAGTFGECCTTIIPLLVTPILQTTHLGQEKWGEGVPLISSVQYERTRLW